MKIRIRAAFISLILLTLLLGGCAQGNSVKLNGKSYSGVPTADQFLKDGWTIDDTKTLSTAAVGMDAGVFLSADESPLPFRVIWLSSGDDHICIYLNDSDVNSGVILKKCRVEGVELTCGALDSFRLGGHEIVGASSSAIKDFFGEPDSVNGSILSYSTPFNISFTIDPATDEVFSVILFFGAATSESPGDSLTEQQ